MPMPIQRAKPGVRLHPIKTQARSCTIVPSFVGHKFQIHNGKAYTDVTVTEDMVGHKLGEFSPYIPPPTSLHGGTVLIRGGQDAQELQLQADQEPVERYGGRVVFLRAGMRIVLDLQRTMLSESSKSIVSRRICRAARAVRAHVMPLRQTCNNDRPRVLGRFFIG